MAPGRSSEAPGRRCEANAPPMSLARPRPAADRAGTAARPPGPTRPGDRRAVGPAFPLTVDGQCVRQGVLGRITRAEPLFATASGAPLSRFFRRHSSVACRARMLRSATPHCSIHASTHASKSSCSESSKIVPRGASFARSFTGITTTMPPRS